ncbi:unnamed protein product [Nezara viridula]|uniref:Tudor domain-containing protein 1 n=1 Tax=Nezara viridula TaxID=85310 RepID=A0A9P0HK28_NEZVI|nr:unnamed protein product [Nezara viridula]
MEDIHEQLETIRDFVKEEIKCLEDLLHPIDCILSELKESKVEYVDLCTAVNVLASSCKSVDEANGTLIKNVNNLSNILKPSIQWHSNKKEMLEMFYLDGNSPWSFWLTYNPSTEIDSLYKKLELRHSKHMLKKLHNPKVGDFICCYDKKVIFRAVIIEVCNTRIKVINVDRYNIKIIKLDACFEITKDLCEIHANSIQCCLTKDKKFEDKWNEDIGRLLQNTLRECRLTVRIVEEIQALPPLFVVEMYAFNEALEVETNISEWIISRLLPELKHLPSDHDHVLDYFSDEALDPFLVSNVAQSSSVPSSLEIRNETKQLSPNAPDDISSFMKNISLEENSTKDKPRNRLAHLMNADITGASTNVPLKLDNNSFVAEKLSTNSNFSDVFSSNGMVQFRPIENVAIPAGSSTGKETNEVYDESVLNGFREDSVIPGNYFPTDDDRICSFFVKKGFCWKPSCKKLHTKVSRDKWTEDSAELYTDTVNSPNLPAIGSFVTMKVTYVVLCNIFYALLPENFSDTVEGCETAASLNKSLNSPEAKKEFKLLSTPPCLGQLLVAYSSEKSMWLRASVRDVLDNGILQVFFVDFGVIEELSLDKCREIEPQFIHLPCQAVYCTLANIFVESGMDDKGKSFVKSLLLDQEIEVQIIDSDVINNRLEVVAFHNGVNINRLLIDKEFCLPFHR